MSTGRVCDQCGEVLVVGENGDDDDDDGEISAWLSVGTLDGSITADACSRSCAIELLADDSWLAAAIDERLAAIAEVVRTLRDETDDA